MYLEQRRQVINNLIAYWGVPYITDLTVDILLVKVNTKLPTMHRQQHQFLTAEELLLKQSKCISHKIFQELTIYKSNNMYQPISYYHI